MEKLKEEDFKIGETVERNKLLLVSEECNEFIDSVLDKISNLGLTNEELKEIGIEMNDENSYSGSWKRAKFVLGCGNTLYFSRRISYSNHKVCSTEYELTQHGQNDADAAITFMSRGMVVGSHRLFSYNDRCEKQCFDRGITKDTKIYDVDNKLTQYSKSALATKLVFNSDFENYSYEYLNGDSYNEEFKEVDGNYKRVYTDLEGNLLTQPELIATSFDSFDEAYATFNDRLVTCRNIIDRLVEELGKNKTR